MDANVGYPSCEIEVRGHRLRVYLDQAIIALGRVRRVRDGSELRVFQSCHNRWGKQFRVRAGGKYYTFECCAVCGQRKTEEFWYDELRPLLPAEWWDSGAGED